jgi:Family of unknown function (DUF5973)
VSTTVIDTRPDLDDVLYQSVVDEEFRELLAADPGSFGLSAHDLSLPTPVEGQDHSLLDLVSGVQFSAQCRSTCTGGPFTIICDGTTK